MVFSPIEGVCDTPKKKKDIRRLYHITSMAVTKGKIRTLHFVQEPCFALKGKIKGRGYNNLCRFILDLCFLNNYLLAVIITALGAKSVRSLEFTAV